MAISNRQLLLKSFFAVQGPFIGVVGLVLSMASWLIPVNTTATVLIATIVRWSVPLAFIVTLAFSVLAKALISISQLSQLPRVLHGRPGPAHLDGERATLLLLENSDLYGHDAVVSVYYIDGSEFEELIGVGYVRNIQVDGKIQILLDQVVNRDVIGKLAINDAAVLKRVRVKPSAPHGYVP